LYASLNSFLIDSLNSLNEEALSTAKYSNFRTQKINKIEYALCPVPFLYDEERNLESGFALEVDTDYFNIYSFEHNYDNDESKIFTKLPHCVHYSINPENYGMERTTLDNKLSANLFIHGLANDLTYGTDSEFIHLDNKFYEQLINRLNTIEEKEWKNIKAVQKRLDYLLEQYDELDADLENYENEIFRITNFVNDFLYGCEDSMENKGFKNHATKEQMEKINRMYEEFIHFGIKEVSEKYNESVYRLLDFSLEHMINFNHFENLKPNNVNSYCLLKFLLLAEKNNTKKEIQ